MSTYYYNPRLFVNKIFKLFLITHLLGSSLSSEPSENLNHKSSPHFSESSEAVSFTPPLNWLAIDPKDLSPHVKAMFVGQAKKKIPPSINLSLEPFSGSLADYLQIVKSINERHGDLWKDLGSIQIQGGEASLSQADVKSPQGTLRLLHVMILKKGTLVILTGASLKEEFSRYYPEIIASLKSLKIKPD